MTTPRSWSGVILALCAAMLWGTTGTAQHFAPAHASPYWIGALRLLVATGVFAVLAAGSRRPAASSPMPPGSLAKTLLAGACMGGYNLAFFAGVRLTGVAIGTTLAIGSGPLFAALLQAVLSRRPPALLWWCGTLLAVAGGAVVALSSARVVRFDAAGVALCLLAGLAYASYTLLAKSLSAHASPTQVTWRVFGVAACVALPIAWGLASASGAPGPGALGTSGWAVVAYLGVVTTGAAYLLFSHALERLSGATAVALALAEPLTAFGLAVLVVGEPAGPGGLAGLLLMVAGLAVVVRGET